MKPLRTTTFALDFLAVTSSRRKAITTSQISSSKHSPLSDYLLIVSAKNF